MRANTAFHTRCPECDHQVPLTLAARLQSARLGTMCSCSNCRHEWICIQEWVYPNRQPIPPSPPPGFAIDVSHAQPGHGAMAPPRPHLPTYQPPGQPAVPHAHRPVMGVPVAQPWAPPQPFDSYPPPEPPPRQDPPRHSFGY